MHDHLCATVLAASGDPETGIGFHNSSGTYWAFYRRNATYKNAIIRQRNANRKNYESNPDEIHRNANS